ncbi:MAG: hypothetical protein R6V36_08625 [Psychroflexus sp.]
MAPSRLYIETTDPTVNDDSSNGYEIGNWWLNSNSNSLSQCVDDSIGDAIWSVKPTFSTGTFTPQLRFGGANVGMTTSASNGDYTRIGDMVTFNIFIALTAKGTSTGNATVLGLPFVTGSENTAFTFYGNRISNSANFTVTGARLVISQDFLRLFEVGSGQTLQNLTDASFVNTSQFFISGSYFL